MSGGALPPALLILLATVIAAAVTLAVIWTVLRQPWLGLGLSVDAERGLVRISSVDPRGPARALQPGSIVLSLGGAAGAAFPLQAADLIEEPDTFATYQELAAFFARQSAIHALLRQTTLPLEILREDGSLSREQLAPLARRPVRDLPAAFWVQVFVGVASFLISAWVWSLRPARLSAALFGLVGVGLLASTLSAAIYSSRELAIDGRLFQLLSGINHAGALGFGAAMIALLLTYPRRIAAPRHLLIPAAGFAAWALADYLQLPSGPPVGLHLPVTIAMAGIVLLALWQYRLTRGDPLARASLTWFGLGAIAGAGAFVLTIIAPNLIGAAPALSQGYAFLFFLLIHIGLAFGIARYRLFDLDEWAFRILFYLLGALILVALDAVLVLAVSLERTPALGVSLLVVAMLYLPLRDTLARRLGARRSLDRESRFKRVLEVALTPFPADQNARWQQLLREVFDPLRLQPAVAGSAAGLESQGLALHVAGVDTVPPFRLEHAQGGRRLFTPRDRTLAEELRAMLAHAIDSRRAYEKGVAQERARIARDMHDHIGAQLLSALHSRESVRKDAMIRRTLTDLREIINDNAGLGLALDDMLSELRAETAERLAAAAVELDWCNSAGEALPPGCSAVHALRAVVREATSNILKHAQAHRVRIRFLDRGDTIEMHVEDDGVGFDPMSVVRGDGLDNMRARMERLGGSLEIAAGRPGTRICARLPAMETTETR